MGTGLRSLGSAFGDVGDDRAFGLARGGFAKVPSGVRRVTAGRFCLGRQICQSWAPSFSS